MFFDWRVETISRALARCSVTNFELLTRIAGRIIAGRVGRASMCSCGGEEGEVGFFLQSGERKIFWGPVSRIPWNMHSARHKTYYKSKSSDVTDLNYEKQWIKYASDYVPIHKYQGKCVGDNVSPSLSLSFFLCLCVRNRHVSVFSVVFKRRLIGSRWRIHACTFFSDQANTNQRFEHDQRLSGDIFAWRFTGGDSVMRWRSFSSSLFFY